MFSKDDQKQAAEALATEAVMGEDEVFDQDVSPDELRAVAGGSDYDDCTTLDTRDIYDPAFPNCAATVESDSWCGDNDACTYVMVLYQNMRDCSRAWR